MSTATGSPRGSIHVAGVDGCRGGWLAVTYPVSHPGQARAHLCATFDDVLNLECRPRTIAVDMPIGLPERTKPGGRDADIEARAVLGGRQSAIFAVPARAAVMANDYSEACALAMATSTPPRKVSKQAFNLFAKIRELDRLMTPDLQNRVFEVHPEVAFWALNGRTPVPTPKKVKSRPNPDGLAQRRHLLESAGFCSTFLEGRPFPAIAAGADDFLAPTVNACTAARILRGDAHRFPVDPQFDSKGLRIEIWG